jgi:ferritin-like metal-binding protein YciE
LYQRESRLSPSGYITPIPRKEAQMARQTINEQLIKHLTDAHSIEEQALVQMRRAPALAGDPALAGVFEVHLDETETHERRVHERLGALLAEPSKVKDLAGKAGGVAMAWFAKLNPDTPGKLTAHAYSYEHMELAAYELLERVGQRARDERTVAMAREIAGEEAAMAERLEDCFDVAVDASLREVETDDLGQQLDKYIADAHGIENQALSLLEGGPKIAGDAELARLFEEHLSETREHERRLTERLEARGSRPSRTQDAALRVSGFGAGGFFGAQPDTPAKLAGFAFAFEHIESASYELLQRVAERAGDEATAKVARSILAEERAMAARLRARFDAAVDATLGDTVSEEAGA